MTDTWDLNTKLNRGQRYNNYLEVEQTVGPKLQPSVQSTTYTLNSHFKSHLPKEHLSQTPSSKSTF